jgi:hypothetical protein
MRKLTPAQIMDIPLEELRRILEIRAVESGFFNVYIGSRGKVCLTSEIESICMNGATVQINLATAALDDVMEDEAFQYAFGTPEEEAA